MRTCVRAPIARGHTATPCAQAAESGWLGVTTAREEREPHLEVGWGAGQRLYVHSPLFWVKAKRCESTLLA